MHQTTFCPAILLVILTEEYPGDHALSITTAPIYRDISGRAAFYAQGYEHYRGCLFRFVSRFLAAGLPRAAKAANWVLTIPDCLYTLLLLYFTTIEDIRVAGAAYYG